MADDPVLYDDGGSTRIKKILRSGAGDMDDLFKVRNGVGGVGRVGSDETVVARNTSYGTIRISIIDSLGLGVEAVASTAFREFEIASGDHRIKGTLVPNGALMDLVMTVHGPAANPPIIES